MVPLKAGDLVNGDALRCGAATRTVRRFGGNPPDFPAEGRVHGTMGM